ncbi:hypothetical protein KCP75_18930 [Salmonella enterica subsp. enterica]|nr:hypothetical protein KCP75_18930 [Salmonella enterica subsp. enterica]
MAGAHALALDLESERGQHLLTLPALCGLERQPGGDSVLSVAADRVYLQGAG